MVETPGDYAPPVLAVGPTGALYVALTRFESSGSVGVEVLESRDDGATYETIGVFADTNPEHNFLASALVHTAGAPGGDALVLALVEQTPLESYLCIARTPTGGNPDWQLETITVAAVIQEPMLALDPDDAGLVYVAYRAPRIDGGFAVVIGFARSTDGGVSWSTPVEVATAAIPDEITSAALLAGAGGIVHVAWLETGIEARRIIHRRHLASGDPGQAFEPETEIVNAGEEPVDVVLGRGEGPDLLAIYRAGDGAVRTMHSADAGASFPGPSIELVGPAESPSGQCAVGEGPYVYLLYRADDEEVRYRPIRAANPHVPIAESIVSDDGEPAAALRVALWPGSGPAAVWLRREGGLRRPFLDAYWFAPTAVMSNDVPRMPVAGLRASPNPFRDVAAIDVELTAAVSAARVAAYTAGGRLACLLHDGPLPAGSSRLRWDGRDARGMRLPPGVYYLRISLPTGAAATRAVLVP